MIRVHPEDLKANFRQIASYLDFVDILSCKSALNSILNEAIEDLLATFVTSLLHRWTEDPLGLRGIMHENRAVISGSSAVWLLDRFPSQWEPNDLDIYTPFSRARPFIEYFTSQGYNLFSQSKTKIQNPYNDDEEHRIIDLATVFKMERGHRRIDILESMTESAVRPISDFHTTLVMNYISAGTIHILYPRLFFEKKVFLNRAKYTSSNDYIEKYRKRGFEICGGNQVETKLLGGTCPYIERTSKDKHSTTLKISALSGENADRIIPSDNLPVLKWKFTNWDAHRSCNQDLCVVEQFVDAVCCNPIIEAMIKQACNTTMQRAYKLVKIAVPDLDPLRFLGLTEDRLPGIVEEIMSMDTPLWKRGYMAQNSVYRGYFDMQPRPPKPPPVSTDSDHDMVG